MPSADEMFDRAMAQLESGLPRSPLAAAGNGRKRPLVNLLSSDQSPGLAVAPGMLRAGNINLGNRPRVRNADGTISTVRSITSNFDGEEVVIPTVSDDGRIMSDDEAEENFIRTGRHLGMFDNPRNADRFAERLHEDQARMYSPLRPFGSGER